MSSLQLHPYKQKLRYIDGLEYSVDSSTLISVSPGNCSDEQYKVPLSLKTQKTIDFSKSGLNGIDDGVKSNNRWYMLYVIGNTDQISPVECIASLQYNAPSLPKGYNIFRRIGFARVDGSGNLQEGTCLFDGQRRIFWFKDKIDVVTGHTGTTNWTEFPVEAGVPPYNTNDIKLEFSYSIAAVSSFYYSGFSGATNPFTILAQGIGDYIYPGNTTFVERDLSDVPRIFLKLNNSSNSVSASILNFQYWI